MSLTGGFHHPAPHGQDTGGDQELQTDIMRFLAILALCLMAVFALVQGLPQAGEATPEATQRETLGAEIRALRGRVQVLQSQRDALERELTLLQTRQEQARSDLSDGESRLRTLRYRLQRSESRLRDMARALQARSRSLQTLQRQRDAEQRELQRIERRVAEGRQSLARTRPQPEAVAAPTQTPMQTPAKTPAQTRSRTRPQAPEPAEPAVTEAPAPASETTEPERPAGFSLQFASADSLQRLVAAGRVGFYARLADGFWRLQISAGRHQFRRSDAPASLYAMAADTVPGPFRTSLLRSSGRAVDGAAWGVTLPPEIAAAVRGAMQGRRGGTLVIDADGRVRTRQGRGA